MKTLKTQKGEPVATAETEDLAEQVAEKPNEQAEQQEQDRWRSRSSHRMLPIARRRKRAPRADPHDPSGFVRQTFPASRRGIRHDKLAIDPKLEARSDERCVAEELIPPLIISLHRGRRLPRFEEFD